MCKRKRYRQPIINGVREIDQQLGELYERHGGPMIGPLGPPQDWDPAMDPEPWTAEAREREALLVAERRRLVNFLKDHGGLPPGMTEVY